VPQHSCRQTESGLLRDASQSNRIPVLPGRRWLKYEAPYYVFRGTDPT
jgi:hypothetical protein